MCVARNKVMGTRNTYDTSLGWAVCRTPRSDVPACCNEGQSSLCFKRQLFTFACELSCSTKHRRIIARIRLCVIAL